jgi:arsenate reductase
MLSIGNSSCINLPAIEARDRPGKPLLNYPLAIAACAILRAFPYSYAMKKTLYGIPNCDTVKKARTWLADHGQNVEFHDFKKQGLTREILAAWLQQVDWEILVNRKGTTWRKLTDERRAQVVDKASALELMLENPSVIKRPVLEGAGPLKVGFSSEQYESTFGDWPA